MGTVASVAVGSADTDRLQAGQLQEIVEQTRNLLHTLEMRFSHYRDDSAISRWQAGESISTADAEDIARVLAICTELQHLSDGRFSVHNATTGELDTAGYVKGYAIAQAFEAMASAGLENYVIGIGGDAQFAGRPDTSRPWRAAIPDPRRPDRIAAIVDASDRAVATSGSAERGDHIWGVDPTPSGSVEVVSFTVVGPDIARADAYATIGFAMGMRGIDWVAGQRDFTSLIVDSEGSVHGNAPLVT